MQVRIFALDVVLNDIRRLLAAVGPAGFTDDDQKCELSHCAKKHLIAMS